MLPLILSQQVRRGLEDFLRTTFPPSNAAFAGMMDNLFDEESEGKGLFQGPYISLGLPFRQGDTGDSALEILPDWTPHKHQQISWNRLGGKRPLSTLVATGTGSGKTECFLYPIFNFCRRHAGEPGIKAILIYPMNALATDQAKRIAGIIHGDERLKSRMTAGLFIGDDKSGVSFPVMQEHMVITDRDTMLQDPPDILLTNYKMLDLLLLRKKYFSLFSRNAPETLRFLVVDEIHTFDGAQGSDLACLFRRIKYRLGTPENHLCCVGTSATTGESGDELIRYAESIFGESFDVDSIVGEDRLSPEEFLERAGTSESTGSFPPLSAFRDLPFDGTTHMDEYIRKSLSRWFPDAGLSDSEAEGRAVLGRALYSSPAFQRLIRSFGADLFTFEEAVRDYRDYLGLDDLQLPQIRNLMASLFSLISVARDESESGGTRPFLQVRIQLWARELRRMVAPIERSPQLMFSDDRTVEEAANRKALPLVHCRDCGTTGWVSYRSGTDTSRHFKDGLPEIYSHYFMASKNTWFLYPVDKETQESQLELGEPGRLCASCLYHLGMDDEDCPSCGEADDEKLVPIRAENPTKVSKKTSHIYGSHDCPWCSSYNSLTIIGSQAASINAVALSQLFASPYNDDKKVIAFSDSVQDASHRAGFFGARTSQFNLRMAIRQLLEKQGTLTLVHLKEAFRRHYRELLGEKEYFATFLAPGIRWIPEVSSILTSDEEPAGENLRKALDFVDRRLNWDITTELAHRSMIGRTLEKSFSIACGYLSRSFDDAVTRLTRKLSETIGGMENLDESRVRWFLLGFLRHLRHRGAVLTDQTRPYVREKGNSYLLGGIPGSPDHQVIGHSRSARYPAFLAPAGQLYERFDNLPRSQSNEQTWYALWARKVLRIEGPRNIDDYINDIYNEAVGILHNEAILGDELAVQEKPIWGLNESAILVTPDTASLSCDREGCGEHLSVSQGEAEAWLGMPCPGRHCGGHLKKDEASKSQDYYRRMYEAGTIGRIIPAEHTGLLTRAVRESLETDFIRRTHPWSPNVLSATPTLEMGIDIGDLSSVLLCSVPPTVSNYLQRIGRAGRKDGNAFVFTTAVGRPHDNDFFSRPQAMMAGEVETPGLFLDAPKVLERQFLAFALDTWLHRDEGELPYKVRNALVSLESGSDAEFPRTLQRFFDTRGRAVLDDFFRSFGDLVSPAVKDALTDNLLVGEHSVIQAVENALRRELKERASLEGRRRRLKPRIDELEGMGTRDKSEEEELEELKNEETALGRFISMINRKGLLEFLTDEGLLPNYMFPETGVTLKSVILKERSREAKEAGEKRPVVEFEYVRPSAAAITELAPENTFYAGGIRAEIDQIDLNVSELEEWRLCDRCHHSAPKEGEEALGACPRCGSTGWRNITSIRKMIRLKQVTATVLERNGLVQDESDERNRLFYENKKLIEVPADQNFKAFRVSGEHRAFGFELVPRVDIREINFGNKENSGPFYTVAGMEFTAQGFAVCTKCGKVNKHGEEERHAPYCPVKTGEAESVIENGIYLYRDFSSEAVRILLPYEIAINDVARESFVAGLFLGLKKYWAGKIDHIHATDMNEPDAGGRSNKTFLVLFDTVPGGTGYLKQLMNDPMSLFTVMDKARSAMAECSCDDGCYKCLFAYSNQYNRASISKQEAVAILTDLLSLRENVEETDSLSGVDMNDYLDSELEARFIEALRRSESAAGRKVKISDHFNQKYGTRSFRMEIGEAKWDIVPQVNLGHGDGVSRPSKPDFLFERRGGGTLPVAVFTDGYQFHAHPEVNRLADDVAKRNALLDSGGFRVWSLSWNDVDEVIQKSNPLSSIGVLTNSTVWRKVARYSGFLTPELKKAPELGNLNLFLRFLENSEETVWKGLSYGIAVSLNGEMRNPTDSDVYPEDWMSPDKSPIVSESQVDRLRIQTLLHRTVANHEEAQFLTRCRLEFDDESAIGDEDVYKSSWNHFLGMMNVLQFLEKRDFRTAALVSKAGGTVEDMTDELANLLELILDKTAAEYIRDRYRDNPVLPIPGFEVCGVTGVVIADAEAAWPETKECILTDDEDRPAVEAAGWTVITPTGPSNGANHE